LDALQIQVFSLTNQVKNLSEPREVDPLFRFQRMLFEEGNDPFDEVIQPPNPVRHPITVIGSNNSAPEEFLQSMEQLNVAAMLDDREFREHLKLAGHLWMWSDADVKATFTVDKSDYPLSF
jgi:hypothetical protein